MNTITTTRETSTGLITLTETVAYEIPRKGDTIYCYGHSFKLEEDMEMRVEFDYDKQKKKYTAAPMRDYLGNLVFVGAGVTWRNGEEYTKG